MTLPASTIRAYGYLQLSPRRWAVIASDVHSSVSHWEILAIHNRQESAYLASEMLNESQKERGSKMRSDYYTHFQPSKGSHRLFANGTCDRCKGEVLEPNSIKVIGESAVALQEQGLEFRKHLPVEILPVEHDGSYCCESCTVLSDLSVLDF